MHFTNLPEDCVHLIFGHLPLQVLLLAACLVSRQWNAISRSLCRRVQALTLIVGDQRKDFLCERMRISARFADQLLDDQGRPLVDHSLGPEQWKVQCANLDEQTVQQLVATFPNIVFLQIGQFNVSFRQLPQVNYLLQQWATKLKSLSLRCVFAEMNSYSAQSYIHTPTQFGVVERALTVELLRLFETINHLPALKNLTFETDNKILPLFGTHRTIYLPIIAQLEQFRFYSKDTEEVLLDSLQRFAKPNDQLQQIELGNSISGAATLKQFLHFSPNFARKFRHLNLAVHDIRLLDLTSLYNRFSNLHSTSLYFLNFADPEVSYHLLSSLSTLKQLRHLKLELNYRFIDEPLVATVQLPSVKMLTIFLSTNSHGDLGHFPLHQLFPSMQLIKLRLNSGYSCAICKRNVKRCSIEMSYKTWTKCTRLLLAPLRQCTSLRRLYKSNGDNCFVQVQLDQI